MLLEDNEIIARLLSTLLKNQGLHVVWAGLGLEGLRQFDLQPERFALVVSDCRLPDIDGREVCHQLLQRFPELPVLLTSGRVIPDGLAPLTAGPRVQFLPKPYSPSELVARVKAMVGPGARGGQMTFAGFV